MTKTLQLNLTSLLEMAMIEYWVSNILNNLLMVVEYCNAGCDVTFDENGIIVNNNGVIVILWWKENQTHPWRAPLEDNIGIPPPPKDQNDMFFLYTDHPTNNGGTNIYNCKEHSNSKNFIMPHSSLLLRPCSLLPSNKDTCEGAQASPMTVPNGTSCTKKQPQCWDTSIKKEKGPTLCNSKMRTHQKCKIMHTYQSPISHQEYSLIKQDGSWYIQ